MGTRGPVPKRDAQRRRRNVPDEVLKVASAGSAVCRGPELGLVGDVHSLASDWYEALRVSGQGVWFEASDWAQARVWTDLLSRALYSDRPSAVMVAAWSSGAAELLTTEGARRRVRVELERGGGDADEDAAVASLAVYRKQVGA